jgi:DNA-binding transcriptional ArsR family regulator
VIVSDFDRAVFQSLAAYCFHEAVCWPSQTLIARELGVSQPTVSRSVGRLREAGWLKIIERRWGSRCRKLHNVYELLEAWKPISRWVAAKIVKRARDRRFWAVNSNRRSSTAKPGWRAPRGAHSRPPDPPPRQTQASDVQNGIVGEEEVGSSTAVATTGWLAP